MSKQEKRPVHEFDRKGIKKLAHANVRSHYVFLLFVCLILIFIGTEYDTSAQLFEAVDPNTEISSTGSGALYRGNVMGMVYEIQEKGIKKGSEEAKEREEEYKKDNDNPVLGRSRGVFASFVNNFTSGYLFVQVMTAIGNLSHSKNVGFLLAAILMTIIYFGIWLLVRNPITGVVRRLFLEARAYKTVPVHDAVFIQSVHRWGRVSITLAVKTLFETLWWITIIGGIIKSYSYKMVPYIVAENPDIKPLDAITLSRKMMYGHKWEAFVLDVTMLGWRLLSGLTAGFSDIFYGVAYDVAVGTEYYVHIRECAKLDDVENADLLNDTYLYEHADQQLLQEKYADISSTEKYANEHTVEVKPWQMFFIKNFGVWLGDSEKKNEYQKIESMKFQVSKEKEALSGNAYPRRLHPLYDAKTVDLEGTVSAFRCYTVWSLILMFFAFSFVGWLWEVSLHIITDGVFVNRGTMHGPWLPIYGFGAIYILIFLNRLRKNVLAEFIGAIILSGFVEYMTSWYLEATKGMRWWDYTGYFLNLNGRICGEGLLIFGLGGIAVVYLIAPLLDQQISKIKNKQVIAACVILLAAYNIDAIYTKSHPNMGEGITDYGAYKENKPKTKAELPFSNYQLRL